MIYRSSLRYSLEPHQTLEESSKGVKGRSEVIPFRDETFDLVISNAAIPNVFLKEPPKILKEKVKESLSELMRVTKKGGEIRLGRVQKGDAYESQKQLFAAIEESLEELRRTHQAEIEEIHSPPDTYEYDENHKPVKLLARSYLIKIRKPINK